MTTDIDSINANPWKRIKVQYLTAVAGLALAAGGAIAAAGWDSGDSSNAVRKSQPSSASRTIVRQVESPQVAFYLVSSQAEAAQATRFEEQAAWVRLEANVLEPNRTFHILMAGTKAEEETAQLLIAESTFVENVERVAFSVIDLRGR